MRIDAERPFGRRECPSCATDVPANSNRCPICGYVFPSPTPTQRNLRLWGALVMLALMMMLLILGLM